eukprot:TRINITY_DN66271_c0_g1_i1.p1 TRINITY_DN66271_c0_g1~~TRINITY_DN66271_c0_g1_i1.p1  ORF type:complete len:136 (+),score=7.26 TRINITY_DN66271_c0_g1_i1:57-410(+)
MVIRDSNMTEALLDGGEGVERGTAALRGIHRVGLGLTASTTYDVCRGVLVGALTEVQHGDTLGVELSLIHISEPTRLLSISYAVFCLKKKKKTPRNYTSLLCTILIQTIIHINTHTT